MTVTTAGTCSRTEPQCSKPLLFGAPKARETEPVAAQQHEGKHHYLEQYNKKCKRNKKAGSADANGETCINKQTNQRNSVSNHTLLRETAPSWKLEVDTAAKLRRGKFGPPR